MQIFTSIRLYGYIIYAANLYKHLLKTESVFSLGALYSFSLLQRFESS